MILFFPITGTSNNPSKPYVGGMCVSEKIELNLVEDETEMDIIRLCFDPYNLHVCAPFQALLVQMLCPRVRARV